MDNKRFLMVVAITIATLTVFALFGIPALKMLGTIADKLTNHHF